MSELKKHGEIGKAALRAGMDRKTARKYRGAGKLPSELKQTRTYRTRKNLRGVTLSEGTSRPEIEGQAQALQASAHAGGSAP